MGNLFHMTYKKWIIVIVSFVAILYFFNPSSSLILPPCMFYKLTGFYCPGCGTLRAIYNIIHLNFSNAFFYNPLSVSVMIAFIIYFLFHHISKATGINLIYEIKTLSPFEGYILLAVIVLYWIARNIHCYPLIYLAPHGP